MKGYSHGNELQKPAGIFAEIPASNLSRLELVNSDENSCLLDAEGHCVTCSDEAQPARVMHIDLELGTALVEIKNQTTEVDITLVEGVLPGDWLLVHGGVAIATIEESHSSDGASDGQH
jgi:hydrogenase assembly chaperone HypC/HupF